MHLFLQENQMIAPPIDISVILLLFCVAIYKHRSHGSTNHQSISLLYWYYTDCELQLGQGHACLSPGCAITLECANTAGHRQVFSRDFLLTGLSCSTLHAGKHFHVNNDHGRPKSQSSTRNGRLRFRRFKPGTARKTKSV